jgi:hypothetical protein
MKSEKNVAVTLIRNSWMRRYAGAGTLIRIRFSMSSPMSAFSIKEGEDDFSEEFADVSGATAFLLRGTEGRVTPLWDGAGIRSSGMAEGVADRLPTTVVAGAGAC